MPNNRIHWGAKQVGFASDGSQTFTAAHGVQSVGITTNYNLEQAFEVGQLALYQNLEAVPDVTVDIEKVLDGYPPIYTLATVGATDATLSGRSNAKTTFGMSLFPDTNNSSSGTPIAQLVCSGMFVSQVGYNFNVNGFFTESVTLLGTSKIWTTSPQFTFSGQFLGNNDQPLAISSGAGGVQRRQNLVFTTTATALDTNGQVNALSGATRCTILPRDIPGISSSGTNDRTGDVYGCHVQSINVSASLGREPIFELGRRFYYFRYVQFPVQVTADIEIMGITGDLLNVTEAGAAGSGLNLNNQTIKVATQEGLFINLGPSCKLNNIAQTGGNTDGANQTYTFSYLTFNFFTVQHLMDPSGF